MIANLSQLVANSPSTPRYTVALWSHRGSFHREAKIKEDKKQPSKESVRQWLRNQIEERRPPPDPKQIRRELGWELLKLERGEPPKR